MDSSALVKRYLEEPGSEWVRSIAAESSSHAIIVAETTLVEVASALARQQRSGDITDMQRESRTSLFLADLERCEIMALDRDITKSAMHCCHRFSLRAYDAIQLATALALQERLRSRKLPLLTFVSADKDLLAAAAMPDCHLETVDPNTL